MTINGKEISRVEVIEALREIYSDWCKHESRRDGCSSTRLPDYEDMLDQIERDGLPPKNLQSQ